MREIKFLAWDKKTKQICVVLETDFKNWVLLEKLKGQRLNERKYSEVVLMQYTGLNDKNGNELYEGDIVVFTNKEADNRPVEITWENYQTLFDSGFLIGNKLTNVKIIDNTCENGDLLK